MSVKKVLPVNSSLESINPTQDDTLLLIRRMLRSLEALSVVDSSNRQRCVIDAMNSVTLSTVSTVTTVGTISAITTFPISQIFEMTDRARIAYNTGIRNNISFS